ncbi:MAG: tetratricopeptide repeat protein [Oligoflexales bacterium]
MSNLPNKILIIDDDVTVAGAIKEPLEKQHEIKVLAANELETGMYMFNQNRFDVVLVEANFEPNPGLVIIQKWRKHEVEEKRQTGFILMVDQKWSSNQEKLQKELRDIEVIMKPFTIIQLLPVLARAKANKLRNMKYNELRENALALTRHNKLDKAMESIKKQLPELGSRGLEMMAEMYEDQKKYDQALEVVDKLVATDKENITFLNMKGKILLKLGKAEEALKIMEQADKSAAGNIERINNMIMGYLHMNEPDKSIAKMKELIKFSPEDPEVKFDMFAKLHEFGFDKHAENFCRETTAPLEVIRHFNNKGVALARGGKVREAILEYERSLRYYPTFKENYRIYYNIALAHATLKTRGSLEAALAEIEKCLQMKPGFDKAVKTRETILGILGKGNKAG